MSYTMWSRYEVPFAGDLYVCRHEVAAVARAALLDMFKRFPYGGNDTVPDADIEWRVKSLEYAAMGRVADAVWMADGTGVPQEELAALCATLTMAQG